MEAETVSQVSQPTNYGKYIFMGVIGFIVIIIIVIIWSLVNMGETIHQLNTKNDLIDVAVPTGTPGVDIGTVSTGQTSGTNSTVSTGQTSGTNSTVSTGQTSGTNSTVSTGQTSGVDDEESIDQTSGVDDEESTDQGSAIFVPPVDDTEINNAHIDVKLDLKIVTLYPGKNYTGDPKTLIPGMEIDLGNRVKDGFVWNSMKVTKGVKLVFLRYTGGGRTSRGFAYGLFNIADIRAYMESIPKIGGNWNIDTGVNLNRSYSGGGDNITLKIAVDDDSWFADMKKSHKGCMNTVDAWNRGNYNRWVVTRDQAVATNTAIPEYIPTYKNSYCDNALVESLKMTPTIS